VLTVNVNTEHVLDNPGVRNHGPIYTIEQQTITPPDIINLNDV